jgi:hypothetical protein
MRWSSEGGRAHDDLTHSRASVLFSTQILQGDGEQPQRSPASGTACRAREGSCTNDLIAGRAAYEVLITCLTPGFTPNLSSAVAFTWWWTRNYRSHVMCSRLSPSQQSLGPVGDAGEDR